MEVNYHTDQIDGDDGTHPLDFPLLFASFEDLHESYNAGEGRFLSLYDEEPFTGRDQVDLSEPTAPALQEPKVSTTANDLDIIAAVQKMISCNLKATDPIDPSSDFWFGLTGVEPNLTSKQQLKALENIRNRTLSQRWEKLISDNIFALAATSEGNLGIIFNAVEKVATEIICLSTKSHKFVFITLLMVLERMLIHDVVQTHPYLYALVDMMRQNPLVCGLIPVVTGLQPPRRFGGTDRNPFEPYPTDAARFLGFPHEKLVIEVITSIAYELEKQRATFDWLQLV